MKLSQAVDLYIQRKRDAGMRFDSPMRRLRSFLRHCGDIDLHHITTRSSPSSTVRAICPADGVASAARCGPFSITGPRVVG
jgi:hypothetical protein